MSYTGQYSPADVALIQNSGCLVEEVDKQWAMFPDQDLETALGSVVGLKRGQGQERNEPFKQEPEQEKSTEAEQTPE